ncbi:MAG TPA: GNAT family protein [Casimicrobiaceae bacterium]|nr:GNAT family protein [Casimicrobiaceae bacterium]
MVSRANKRTSPSFRIYLRRPRAADAKSFLAAVAASRRLHGTWVTAPSTSAAFRDYLARFGGGGRASPHIGYLAARVEDDALVGVLNLSEIVRGSFQSAYLGYYAFAPHARHGYMTEALALLLDRAYGEIALHRVEVNVQPTNRRSLALIERAGFTREGFSRRYVKIGGRWRDHVRYALLVEDWARARRKLVATSSKAR